MRAVLADGPAVEVRAVPVSSLAEHYRRYRLADPAAEAAMALSLLRYGQLAPLTACWREGRLELLDGFKRRLAAAARGVAELLEDR